MRALFKAGIDDEEAAVVFRMAVAPGPNRVQDRMESGTQALSRGQWRLLCYHGFPAEDADAFARQLASFRARGFTFRSFDEALAGSGKGRHVTVTFDDGDRRTCEVAQPVLDSMGIKAIQYVATDFILKGKVYDTLDAMPATTWDQLGRWLDAGHAIGSHTHTHPVMIRATVEQQREELEQSRATLRRYLGIEVTHFSYPFGLHDVASRHSVHSAGGWRSAATIDRGWNTDSTDELSLHRDLIYPRWPDWKTRLLFAMGTCPWMYRIQRHLRGRQ